MQEFSVSTRSRTEFVDITRQIQSALSETGLKTGVCTVFIPHTTAGVTINENADPDVQRDMLKALNKVIPFDDDYRHGEGNSAAHIKATLTGSSVSMPVEDGQLCLGTWQGVYFCEFDGPRDRRVWVQAR